MIHKHWQGLNSDEEEDDDGKGKKVKAKATGNLKAKLTGLVKKMKKSSNHGKISMVNYDVLHL